jgi:TIR domain
MADIFVSYTSSDRDWAFWIGHELEALGHKAHIHEWEVSGGGNVMAWMTAPADAAAHMLCVAGKGCLPNVSGASCCTHFRTIGL